MRNRPRVVGTAAMGFLVGLLGPMASAAGDHRHHSHHSKKDAKEIEAPPPPSAIVAPEPVGPPPAISVDAVRPDDGKPIATVLMADEDLGPRVATDVLASFAATLSVDDRIHYRDPSELLEPSDGAAAEIAAADLLLDEARAAFDQMDLDGASKKVDEAITVYKRHLPLLGASNRGLERMRDAWIRLVSVRFLEGNVDAAREALRHVFVFDPKIDYSPKRFPPQMKKTIVEGRLLFEAMGNGKVAVTSTPPGAAVYLNGAVKGVTPTTIDDAPAGPNELTVARPGWQSNEVVVEVQGAGDEVKVEVALLPFDPNPIANLRAARPQLGMPIEPEPLVLISRQLKAPLVVVVQGARTGAGLTLTAFLYDARSRQLLKRVARSASADGIADVARQVARELFGGVRLDGKYVPPEPEKKPTLVDKLREFRGSKYFWPVVGGVGGAVVVGTAVGLGVGLGQQHGLTPAETIILLGTSR